MSTKRGRRAALALATTGALATGVLTAGTASATEVNLIVCVSGSVSLTVDEDDYSVSGTATLTSCTSLLEPAITSGTIQITGEPGSAAVTPLSVVLTNLTDVITWNTGKTTTETVTRTYVGLSTVVGVGVGASTAGLFHPEASTETGPGSRTHIPATTGIGTRDTGAELQIQQNGQNYASAPLDPV